MNRIDKTVVIIMGLILVSTIAIRHASPIKDSDFFWHSAYAKYMLEHKTLTPDHTIYSWTPADNDKIKCNWFAEILVYVLYQTGGLNLLFALRYAIYFLVFILLTILTLRAGQKITPIALGVISIALVSSSAASFIKPELFSLLYFSLIYFVFFYAKANQVDGQSTRVLLWVPLIFLFWVNSHEVVLFGMIAFGTIVCGECLNYFVKGAPQPNKLYIKHLCLAALGSVIVFFINPYGYQFPFNLIAFLVQPGGNTFGGIEAYHSIFYPTFFNLHYFDFWIIMTASMSGITAYSVWKEKTLDWAIVLPTIFLAAIYLKYVRATYYWPTFWAMGMIYQFSRLKTPLHISMPVKKGISIAVCILLIFLSSRIIDTAIRKPFLGQFFGFGIGYSNPVQSCEFLKRHRPGEKIYNSYGTGGYLTLELYPSYKVFIDARYFPYSQWYEDYYALNHGQTSLEAFTIKYPFDTALVDYHYSKNVINALMEDKEWQLAFYGNAAAVFVRKKTALDFRGMDLGRFDHLRSIHQAYTVFNFAQNVGDFEASEYLFDLMRRKFAYMQDYDLIMSISSLSLKGLQAMRETDYGTARRYLEAYGLRPYMVATNQAILKLRDQRVKQLMASNQLEDALGVLEETLSTLPRHLNSLYNAGVIGYMLEKSKPSSLEANPEWRHYLRTFVELAPAHKGVNFAKRLLAGEGAGNVPLIF